MKQNILLLFLVNVVLSSNIESFSSYNTVVTEAIKDVKSIFESFKWKDFLSKDEIWEYKESGELFNSYLRFTSFGFESIKYDLSTLKGVFNSRIEITSTKSPAFELSYTFHYIGRSSFAGKVEGNGTLKISNYDFNFRKKEVKLANSTSTINAGLVLGLSVSCDLTGTLDDTMKTYLSMLKSDYVLLTKAKLIQKINEYVSTYYTHKSRTGSITFETTIPNMKYTYNFALDTDPEYRNSTGVVYVYKGSLKRTEQSRAVSQYLKNSYPFNPADGDSQVLLPYTLMKTVFDDFGTTEKIKLVLNEKTMIPEFKFKLNVDFLGHIIPAIYNEKERDEKISIQVSIGDLNFDEETNSLDCWADFDVLDSKSVNIFSWTAELMFDFEAKVDINNAAFNFNALNVKLAHTTVTLNKYGAVEMVVLNTWIEQSFDSLINKFGYSLFKGDVVLKDFIKFSKVKIVSGGGILLIN